MPHTDGMISNPKSLRGYMARYAAACLLLAAPALVAQSSKSTDSKCKTNPKDAACTSQSTPPADNGSAGSGTAPSKSLHDAFPFPTDDSKHGGDADSTGTDNKTTDSKGTDGKDANSNGLPSMPTDPVPDPPASSDRPLNPPPTASGSSSSSSSSSDDDMGGGKADDDDDVAPTTAAPNAPVKAKALKDLGSHGDSSAARAKLEKTRVADDLKVAKFYLNDGNNQGAYLRYKDAVEHDPEDPDARFGLAETANKLNKHDEALLNYKEYLNLDAGGDHDRATRQALTKLGAQPKQ